MKSFADNLGIEFNQIISEPTIGGRLWEAILIMVNPRVLMWKL